MLLFASSCHESLILVNLYCYKQVPQVALTISNLQAACIIRFEKSWPNRD